MDKIFERKRIYWGRVTLVDIKNYYKVKVIKKMCP